MEQMQSFTFGAGFGDMGVMDQMDLSALDLTDTLLGSARNELSASLGYAEENAYEAYHKGDVGGGISDISLTAFDSGLIADAGIRPYTQDKSIQDQETVSMDEVAEVADMMVQQNRERIQKMGKEAADKKTENDSVPITDFVEKYLASHDTVTKNELDIDWLRWNDSAMFEFSKDGVLEIIDDEDRIGEDDVEEDHLEEMEFDQIMHEAEEGLLSETLALIGA